LVETLLKTEKASLSKKRSEGKSSTVKVSEVQISLVARKSTGDGELDNVLGGGVVGGMVVLVAGEPGIGKSTLLTQMAIKYGNCLYICGEESANQIGLRVKRLKLDGDVDLFESIDIDEIVGLIETSLPSLVVLDSIQTVTTEDLTGVAGSVGQVRECALRLINLAKTKNIPVFIVGHVTKEGNIAGPRVLEHMVDTVLWFEGERGQNLRLVRAIKNRFGPTDEVGIFEMTEGGLMGISNPSKMLLSERVKNVPGSVISVVMEGKRPLLVEIQALVVQSQMAVPRRVATGVDFARLQMLVAVLIKRANLHIENSDIYVNVTGGIKLADRGIDLAICLAIASSHLNRSLDAEVAAVGEVGLLGEVRKVSELERRVKEAKRLGYKVASAESGKCVEAAIVKLLH
jgi:DNA repair protein RadA/Sms